MAENSGSNTHIIYKNEDEYASFPGIIQTNELTVIPFSAQNLKVLSEADQHPHYGLGMRRLYAISKGDPSEWSISEEKPRLEKIKSSVSGIVMEDGSIFSLRFPTKGKYGPVEDFYPHANILRLEDGSLLAAGYGNIVKNGINKQTVVFLKGTQKAENWEYLSHIELMDLFSFSEPCAFYSEGRIIVILRTDWDTVPKDLQPPEANGNGMKRDGYGYYLYQTVSEDNGKTWSIPVQLPFWGHPAYVIKLRSGNIMMVYGQRRPPFCIKAVLSKDGGITWDKDTLKILYTFNPGNIDLGYPVAVQQEDGKILCAYYGPYEKNVDMPDIFTWSNKDFLYRKAVYLTYFEEEFLLNTV